jgi:uncharacterized protein
MRRFLLVVLIAGFFATSGGATVAADAKPEYKVGDRLAQPGSSASSVYKETGWDVLVPKDWDPMKELRALKLGTLKDSDPRADEALRRMRELWDAAPIEASLQGERIRIAGFMVPLERKGDRITEFLLVPYFGACIHVPPPPANQIIHVITRKPMKNAQAMAAVWVSGTVEIAHTDSEWGASGYRMKADIVLPYTETR